MLEEELMSPKDLSEYLQVPIATLYQWHHKNEGPRAMRIGRHLRYRREDVEEYLRERSDDRRCGVAAL